MYVTLQRWHLKIKLTLKNTTFHAKNGKNGHGCMTLSGCHNNILINTIPHLHKHID